MKKILTLLTVLILVASCWAKTENNTDNKKTEQKVEKYSDITKYIKSDITDEESKELLEILEQRVERQSEVKGLIEASTKETSEEIYLEIVEKRKICAGRISPYVSEDQMSSFLKYCEKMNFQIKKTLDSK